MHAPGVEVSRKQKENSSKLTLDSKQSTVKTVESKKGCTATGATAMQCGTSAPFTGWTLPSTTREKLPRGKTLERKKREQKARLKSSTRPAPVIDERAPQVAKAQAKKRGSQQNDERQKAIRSKRIREKMPAEKLSKTNSRKDRPKQGRSNGRSAT